MKEITATNPSTELLSKPTLNYRVTKSDHSPIRSNSSASSAADGVSATSAARPFRVAMVPMVFELYDIIVPDLRSKFQRFFAQVLNELHIENVEFVPCEMVSNLSHLKRVCEDFSNQAVDTIVLAHLSYVPSGQILSALTSIKTPIVLWPAQTMERMVANELSDLDVFLNHGVHGTMDLANMMRRAKRPYGVVHGHWKEPGFQCNLFEWFQVGAMLQSLRNMNPLIIGERFPDMLDLRLEDEPFMETLGIRPRRIPLAEFVETRHQIDKPNVLEIYEIYRERFEIDPSLDKSLLLHTAKNEAVLRCLLEKYQSQALAVNFLDVCNEPEIADSLHLPVSNLMSEGIGYGAEADWETASMISAMQTVFGNSHVGFTEVFSVDYGKNRGLLRHWGEGNIAQASGKPKVILSDLKYNSAHTKFPICDFQFSAGMYTLLNLSVTPEGQGQLITIPCEIEATQLPHCNGVNSLFRVDGSDVRDLLNQYAFLGGSHHLALIQGNSIPFVEKLARQAGWIQHTIK